MKQESVKTINNSNDVRLAILETTIVHINETLIRMEKRFDKLDDKIDRQFNWLLGILIPILLSIFGALIMIYKH